MDCASNERSSVVRAGDRELARQLESRLRSYQEYRQLPGVIVPCRFQTLVQQLIESVRRVRYVSVLRERDISPKRSDPGEDLFDPIRAAVYFQRQGHMDEAFWMVFLFVHFGKHFKGGWRYAREIYGRLGSGDRWDWASTSADPGAFRTWLNSHELEFRRKGVAGGFGNHRKYQSLNAYSDTGTGAAFETYVRWVNPPRTHCELIMGVHEKAEADPRRAFHELYVKMDTVASFGRTARFDYLCMVGKLQLAPIEPGSTYLEGSTGPFRGARLLFGDSGNLNQYDQWLIGLGEHLSVGMQVLEDAPVQLAKES